MINIHFQGQIKISRCHQDYHSFRLDPVFIFSDYEALSIHLQVSLRRKFIVRYILRVDRQVPLMRAVRSTIRASWYQRAQCAVRGRSGSRCAEIRIDDATFA